MNWQLWYFFVVTETALCFVPGPAVLLVLSQGLRHGTRKAVFSIFGIVAANTVYFALSATGIGAVLMTSYDVFFAIKWIGAAYLVWLGLSAFFGRSKLLSVTPDKDSRSNSGRLFANGFILQMSNPKALVFFSALLPQFIDPHATLWTQVVILAATSVVIEFVVQLFYATIAGRAASFVAEPRFAKITDRVAGSFLIAAGAGLAAVRR
jgi:threonine/homoserine/homoserine lactone efflux protein